MLNNSDVGNDSCHDMPELKKKYADSNSINSNITSININNGNNYSPPFQSLTNEIEVVESKKEMKKTAFEFPQDELLVTQEEEELAKIKKRLKRLRRSRLLNKLVLLSLFLIYIATIIIGIVHIATSKFISTWGLSLLLGCVVITVFDSFIGIGIMNKWFKKTPTTYEVLICNFDY